MVLSTPYDETKESERIAGTVGRPCHEALVRLVSLDRPQIDNKLNVLIESSSARDEIHAGEAENLIGELQIKGPMVFKAYHNKPAQTREAFTDDGWFRTGDTAEFLREKKIYKIVGRTSVDVIKSGAYKISALDIERELLAHPLVDDVAVMGLSDEVWGQKVFALIVLKENNKASFDQEEFIRWCKERLPKQSVPKLIKLVDKMPRNLLGKVNKRDLINTYEKEFVK